MTQKSVTVDEIMYIAAGYYHLKTGDFQMNMTNPPFMKLLSAIPLLAIDLQLPSIEGDPKDWTIIEQWKYSRVFLYGNTQDADLILFLARLPIVLISVVLGVFVFRLGRDLYGEEAGLFALFLYAFSPNILAYSRLATQDIGVAAFMFISTYYWWKYMSRPNAKALILCGIFFGISMLTKLTALFLLIVFAAYASVCVFRSNGLGIYLKLPLVGRIDQERIRLRQMTSVVLSFLIVGLLTGLTLNIGCAFQGTLEPLSKEDHHPDFYKRLPIDNFVTRELSDFILESPIPIPSPYMESARFQFGRKHGGKTPLSLREKSRQIAWWFASFFIKTPLPILTLLLLTVPCLIWSRSDLEAEWLILAFIFTFISIFSYLSDTYWIRYLLPIYPFLHVLTGRLFLTKLRKSTFAKCLVCALSVWYLTSTLLIHPHYLAYFNELIGGPKNGYKYLTESNLDWGQDLKGLKSYMEEKNIGKIKLGYFGSADADYYGINYEYLPSVGLAPKRQGQYWWHEIDQNHRYDPGPQKGYLAVSATLLASPRWLKPLFYETYKWLRSHDPIDQIGHSILIYDIE